MRVVARWLSWFLGMVVLVACAQSSHPNRVNPELDVTNLPPHFGGKNPVAFLTNPVGGCSAFLSNQGYVLSAGHCVSHDQTFKASDLLITFRNPGQPPQVYPVKRILSVAYPTDTDPIDWAVFEMENPSQLLSLYGGVETLHPQSPNLPAYGDDSEVIVYDPSSEGGQLQAKLAVKTGKILGFEPQISTSGRFHLSCLGQPGNSGGPVFDSQHRVIGIVSTIFPETSQTQGQWLPEISRYFTVPVNFKIP